MKNITVRPAQASDASECGRICYQAFTAIANAHNFAPDFPNAEVAAGLMAMLLGHPGFNVIVAELDGKVVGSNVVDERGAIWGLGPITVDPAVQNHGLGERLMRTALARSRKGLPGFGSCRPATTVDHWRFTQSSGSRYAST